MEGDTVLWVMQDLRESRMGDDIRVPGFDEHVQAPIPSSQVIRISM